MNITRTEINKISKLKKNDVKTIIISISPIKTLFVRLEAKLSL